MKDGGIGQMVFLHYIHYIDWIGFTKEDFLNLLFILHRISRPFQNKPLVSGSVFGHSKIFLFFAHQLPSNLQGIISFGICDLKLVLSNVMVIIIFDSTKLKIPRRYNLNGS